MARSVLIAVSIMVASVVIEGQGTLSPARPAFEVASVKPNVTTSDQSFSIETLPGGTLRASNVSVRTLILDAYHLQESQTVGLPNWAVNEKFNIIAKAAGPASDPALWTMMRALLEDRFSLRAHMEEREGPVYFLNAARDDKKLGPKMAAVSRNCAIDSPAPPESPAASVGFCGIDSNTSNIHGRIRGGGQSMAQLATALGTYAVTRSIIDRTGITGTFDFEVEWVPESARLAATGATDGASIFTALQEQLGVRLDSGRGPVPTLVIDRVTRPTPD